MPKPPFTAAPNRRRLLSALAASAVASGLAGCLSGGSGTDETTTDDGGGEDGDDGGSNDGGDGASDDGSGDDPTTEAEPAHVMPADDFDCEGMADGAKARYDDPGERFVFTFEHPESWFVRPRDTASSDGVVVNAPAAVPSGGYLFFATVRQYYQPVSADTVESSGDYESVGSLSFDGEDCIVGEHSAGDPGRVIQSVVVPDGTGTHRQATVDIQNLSFEEACFDDARAVGEGILGSLQPKA